jgi:hypothetical protein
MVGGSVRGMPVDMRITLSQIERLCVAGRGMRDGGHPQAPAARDRTRQWRDLERRFATELCDTSGPVPKLTDAGSAAVAWSEQVLAAADELSGALIAIAAGSRGEIELVVSMMLASYRLPRALATFSALHPEVHIA